MKQHIKIYFQKIGILLAVYLVLRFLLPLVLPFFLAWATVAFLDFARKKIHLKLMPLTICWLIFFILLLVGACFCTWCLLYEPCLELFPICQSYWDRFSEALSWMPEALSGWAADRMPTLFACCFDLFLYLISLLLFAKDWMRVRQMLLKLPFAGPVARAGKRMAQSIRSWAKAQIRIMAVVSVQCAVGYYLLHIPGALFWALLTGLVDALPVFGTGTIFVPWLIIVLLRKKYTFALRLGILYLVTWLTRELLEPKLLGDGLGLLPIWFLLSVIVGLQLFGAVGLFTGPFGILLVRELWAELERSAPPGRSAAFSSGDEEMSS